MSKKKQMQEDDDITQDISPADLVAEEEDTLEESADIAEEDEDEYEEDEKASVLDNIVRKLKGMLPNKKNRDDEYYDEDDDGDDDEEDDENSEVDEKTSLLNSLVHRLKSLLPNKNSSSDEDDEDDEDENDDEDDEDENDDEDKTTSLSLKDPKQLLKKLFEKKEKNGKKQLVSPMSAILIISIVYLALDFIEEKKTPDATPAPIKKRKHKKRKRIVSPEQHRVGSNNHVSQEQESKKILEKKTATSNGASEVVKPKAEEKSNGQNDLEKAPNPLESNKDKTGDMNTKNSITENVTEEPSAVNSSNSQKDKTDGAVSKQGKDESLVPLNISSKIENPEVQRRTGEHVKVVLKNKIEEHQELEKLDNKKGLILAKKRDQYVAQPDYERLGRGLVYNCARKFWACVDKVSYFQCDKNYKWLKAHNKPYECVPREVFADIRDCRIVQVYNINTSEPTDFCK